MLLVTQALLTLVEGGPRVATPAEVAGGLTALFLQAGWYFATLGAIVPSVAGSAESIQAPSGPVYVGAAQAALLLVAPWALLAGILLVRPAGALGAIALLASVVLLISTVVAAGRALGIPVEAALTGARGRELFRQGNDRARENGGLGVAFLGLLVLVVAFAVPVLALTFGLGRSSPLLAVALGAISSWLIGTWIAVAAAISLGGGATGLQTTFTCPACGSTARAQGGMARCECGLEGPFYNGARA